MTRSVLKNSYLRSSRRANLRSRRKATPSLQDSVESDIGSGRLLNFSSVHTNSGNDRTSGSMARRSFPRRAIQTTPSHGSPGRNDPTSTQPLTPAEKGDHSRKQGPPAPFDQSRQEPQTGILRDDVAGDPGDHFSLVAAEKTLDATTEQPDLGIGNMFVFHFPFSIWRLPSPEPIFFNGKLQISNGKWKMKSTPKLLHHLLPDLLLLEVP